MHFSISPEGEILYLVTHDFNNLKILFDCKSNNDLWENEENLFQISTLYQAHHDMVEELIWKKIYTMILLNRFIIMILSLYSLQRAISSDLL